MIIISVGLIALFNYLLIKQITFQHLIDFFLINFLLVCANIILTFEICSLFNSLNNIYIFLLVQLFLACAALILSLFFRRKLTNLSIIIKDVYKGFRRFIKENKIIFAFFILIGLIYIAFAYLSIIFPQNTTDSLYNHLSRIGHWLQQGSLKPYESFNSIGISYPYNNSLLMMWSVLFLHVDTLTGLVQWFASIILALSIYAIAKDIGFSQGQSAFSALVFLTFPIVFLESITAQNDILAATFWVTGIYFFIDGIKNKSTSSILIASLSFGLAIGTKQYVILAVPAFLVIFLYLLLKNRSSKITILAAYFTLFTLIFTLLIGSYAYIQNIIYYKDPLGTNKSMIANPSGVNASVQKFVYNSNRSLMIFISCEGLPLPAENSCLNIKGAIFKKVYSVLGLNLESKAYLLVPDCGPTCFSFTQRYPLNEESAWFGILAWILIIPGVLIATFKSIKQKEYLPILLILLSISYFGFLSMALAVWESYQGRYFILSIALLMPFAGYFLNFKNKPGKVLATVILFIATFILLYTFISNDSKPLASKNLIEKIEKWGTTHSILIKKIVYKLDPWVDNQTSFFSQGYAEEKTYFVHDMLSPFLLVDEYVPQDTSLGIIANQGYVPDYLYFGNHFTRKVFDLVDYSNINNLSNEIDEDQIIYIIAPPDINAKIPASFHLLRDLNGWNLYQRN